MAYVLQLVSDRVDAVQQGGAMRQSSPRRARRLEPAVRSMFVLAILGSLVLTVLLSGEETRAQRTKSVVWDRYNVTIDLNRDGSYHVTERQVVLSVGRSRQVLPISQWGESTLSKTSKSLN